MKRCAACSGRLPREAKTFCPRCVFLASMKVLQVMRAHALASLPKDERVGAGPALIRRALEVPS